MADQRHAVTTSCLATAVLSPTASSSRAGSNVARIQRNVAEKQRRDKLNGYINELANIVPMISKSARRLDKTSILRLSAAHLRICKSSLGANSKMKKTFTWCPNFLSDDQIREIFESVDGFLIITASNGKILFTSRSVERYLGHQDIDMIGHSLYMFIHEKDVDDVKQKMKDMLAECLEKGSSRCSFECLMKEKAQPRSEVSTYQHVHFVGGMTAADDPNSEKPKSVITHMFKTFVKIVDISPYNQLSLEDATADEYVTRHSLDGTIIYADHRLATITGHMPNEVIGLSAYEYIHKDDMPIALFAHHLMFSSDKGTGIIVYRLHTRDNRFIYLKSVGCLQYDGATSQVDHFVCINQQLGDSDGDLQLKYFFDRYVPQVKGSSTSMLLESVKALQLSSSKSSPINHKTVVPVASKNLEISSPRSPGNSDSTISSFSSDSSKSSEENSPDDIMEHCNDSDQIAIQETCGSSPESPDFVHHNGSASPSSVPSPENKEKSFGTISIANDSECLIVTVNGSSSGLGNGFFTSSINSPLNVNQSHSVNTPNKITSPPLQISKNSYSLTEGPNNHVHNNLRMVMGPVVFNSDGSMSPSGADESMSPSDTILQVDAQYEYVGTLSNSDQNKGEDKYSLLKSSHSPKSECKNPVESDNKMNGEMNLYGHQMKLSLSQNGISSEDSSSPLGEQSDNHDEDTDVFHEDTADSFIKHSSFIRNTNGVDGLHSTLTVVNSCDSDSVIRNSKWSVDSFSVFQSTVEENSTLSMDYCETMPTTEDEVNGDLKDNISLQEDLSSLLSATLPHSDSNSLPSANGWNDIFNPTEYSSPFSSEATLQKDEEQLLVSSSKVKSYDLW
ncbi:Circadian locomoter output cycles protein kaput [Araneus ventricosus]|uniref:Circadian locomoter output cycles protein kaput n=1 Tax=Araneus ventricosus TaxID=182803 RepID=A0A4Y2HGX6_ARAVE|nr:Circadian locomoter output cycles protein kaput [Araneus ventricosus]